MIGVQTDCVSSDSSSHDYMHGMLNGMICAHAVMSNTSPTYHTANVRPVKNKVRYKRKK